MHKEAVFSGVDLTGADISGRINYCIDILLVAKDQKTKAGKYKMKQENREAIENFIRFDVTQDWMESKDFTKLIKLLASAVITGSTLVGEPIDTWFNSIPTQEGSDVTDGNYRNTYSHRYGISIWGDIRSLTCDHQWSLSKEEFDHPTDRANVAMLIKRIEALQPIVQKAQAMSKRLTRNGKFPKDEEEKRRRAAIKGSLDKKLLAAFTEIRAEWVKIIHKHELNWRMEQAKRVISDKILDIWNESGVPHDDQDRRSFLTSADIIKWHKVSENKSILVLCTHEEMDGASLKAAEHEGDSWLFKMADKFGGLATSKREFLNVDYKMHGVDAFRSLLTFYFANDSVIHIENKIITNRSPLNTYFYQYPCVFTAAKLDGMPLKNLSELTVKEAFKK